MKTPKKIMSIRTRIIISIFATAMFLGAAIMGVTSIILLSSYDEIENDNIIRDLSRADAAINNSLTHLGVSLIDWSHWDDTYIFAQDSNPEYIEANLDDSTLVNLNINLIIYLNSHNQVIYAKAVDFESGEEVNSENIIKQIMSYDKFYIHTSPNEVDTGMIALDEGILMVASSPILDSEEDMPPTGSLIFGRYVDEEKIDDFRDLTQLSLSIFPLNESELPLDVETAKTNLEQGQEHFIIDTDKKTISGYLTLENIDNKPIGILRVDNSRDIYNNGIKTLHIFIITITISILLITVVVGYLFEKLLITRFTSLTKQVKEISQTNNLSLRVKAEKLDEIGNFATVMNSLLESLQKAQANEALLTEREKEISKDLEQKLTDIQRFNKIMIDRELKMVELKQINKDLESRLKKQGNE
ncbi:hypothetical protein KC926_01870 [Candidatus Kaiserbacteria bacterium]|nr:hypothetical protein [Candidatus Kaiserbacteria bacterium]